MRASKDNSIYVSIPFQQEATENDWIQYQVSTIEKPEMISILSDSTNTLLSTVDAVTAGETGIIYNTTDGIKISTFGSSTQITDNVKAALFDFSSLSNTINSTLMYKTSTNYLRHVISVGNNVYCFSFDMDTFSLTSAIKIYPTDTNITLFYATDIFKFPISGMLPYSIIAYDSNSDQNLGIFAYIGDVSSNLTYDTAGYNVYNDCVFRGNTAIVDQNGYTTFVNVGSSNLYPFIFTYTGVSNIYTLNLSNAEFYDAEGSLSSANFYACGYSSAYAMIASMDSSNLSTANVITCNTAGTNYQKICYDQSSYIYATGTYNYDVNLVVSKFSTDLTHIQTVTFNYNNGKFYPERIYYDSTNNYIHIVGAIDTGSFVPIMNMFYLVLDTNFNIVNFNLFSGITGYLYDVIYINGNYCLIGSSMTGARVYYIQASSLPLHGIIYLDGIEIKVEDISSTVTKTTQSWSFSSSTITINSASNTSSNVVSGSTVYDLDLASLKKGQYDGIRYQIDISNFGLTNAPSKVWRKNTDIEIVMESNPDRCIWQNETLTISNATSNSFQFTDTRADLLMPGDKIIVNGNEVLVTDVSYDSSTNTYTITIDDIGETITSVVIPSRSQSQILESISLDSTLTDYLDIKYQPVSKQGRALRFKVTGNTNLELSRIQIDLWTS